jgi:hypothetical protein
MGAIYRAGEAGTRTLSVIAGTGDVALTSWAATGKLKIETSAAMSAREHSTFFVIYPPPDFPKGVVRRLTVRESERVSNPPANPCRKRTMAQYHSLIQCQVELIAEDV